MSENNNPFPKLEEVLGKLKKNEEVIQVLPLGELGQTVVRFLYEENGVLWGEVLEQNDSSAPEGGELKVGNRIMTLLGTNQPDKFDWYVFNGRIVKNEDGSFEPFILENRDED